MSGLYLHWPYCTRICPYCDFNVYRNRDVDETAWAKAFAEDLAWWAGQTGGPTLSSVYFGGGTPSLMTPALAGEVIGAAMAQFGLADGAEVTLEANPTDAERQRFAGFASAGINRLSLGVQALDDASLSFLGRNHTADEAVTALREAADHVERLTFDLIYARPDQSLKSWREELARGLDLAKGHISLYQLTIEPGTAFEKAVARGDWSPPEESLAADMYDLAQEMCAEAGLYPYEVSNNAAPGHEAHHNLLYWRYQTYFGIGPGAHGRAEIGGTLYETIAISDPKRYLAAPPDERFTLSPLKPEDQAVEYLSMSLRLAEGMSLTRYADLAGAPLHTEELDALTQEGLAVTDGDRLILTRDGRRVLNAVVLDLLS